MTYLHHVDRRQSEMDDAGTIYMREREREREFICQVSISIQHT